MMKEMELNVRMTKDEYNKILPKARNFGDKGGAFAKGDMCFYNGTPYLCIADNTTVSPVVPGVHWKRIFIQGHDCL